MVDLENKFARTCTYTVLLLALIIGVVAVATNSNFVSADPCAAQLGSPTVSMQQYYGSNLQVTVPLSATCSFYTGQLYAAGTAYDTTYNSNIGTANSALSTTYGSNSFGGQLQFNLPTSAMSHSVQLSVSIYSGQTGYYQQYSGYPLTTTSATYIVGPSYQNSYQYPYYPTSPTYPTYATYPTYPTHPTYPTYPSYPTYPGNNYYYHSYPYYNPNPGGYYYYYHNGGYNNNYQYCNRSNNYCHTPTHR